MNITIIQTLSEQDFVIQCGYCRGRGRKPNRTDQWQIKDYTGDTCDICNGKGALRVRVVDVLIPDGRCQGTGLNQASDTNPVYKCPTCGGIGARSLSGELKIVK